MVELRVTPGARVETITGITPLDDGSAVLAVKVRAAPEGGKATESALSLLATTLDMRRGAVTLLAGATARRKRVMLSGDADKLMAQLENLPQG